MEGLQRSFFQAPHLTVEETRLRERKDVARGRKQAGTRAALEGQPYVSFFPSSSWAHCVPGIV